MNMNEFQNDLQSENRAFVTYSDLPSGLVFQWYPVEGLIGVFKVEHETAVLVEEYKNVRPTSGKRFWRRTTADRFAAYAAGWLAGWAGNYIASHTDIPDDLKGMG